MNKITPKLWNWASILEENTRNQALMTSEMDFVQPHIALMPDAHLGKGSTVGSVIPTVGAIMPAAVGVDIGCGMIAVRTQFTIEDYLWDSPTKSKTPPSDLRKNIERSIPLSAGHFNTKISREYTKHRIAELEQIRTALPVDDFVENWRFQLGSLGSGNHFIEVSSDEESRIWLFLHSGSRGVGNKIANYYIRRATADCKASGYDLPHPDLSYFIEGMDDFHEYLCDLDWCQRFALLNREEMMDRVVDQVGRWFGEPVQEQERINCHHNYTELWEDPDNGEDRTWLTRKGAIDASLGKMGLIPGSMATASYVVEGKGNPDAFLSAPHGAGRPFSRAEAKRRFTYDDLKTAMEGIEWSGSAEFLDEIPGAYKPVDIVMADAVDLVTVKHELHQLINIKGN